MGMWVIWTGEEEGDRGALERELPGLACYQSTILKCFKWYCMVWNGMVWYGMVGMVWYGVLPSSNASTYSIPVSGKVKILMKSQSYGFHVTHPIHVAQRRWLANSGKLLQEPLSFFANSLNSLYCSWESCWNALWWAFMAMFSVVKDVGAPPLFEGIRSNIN